MSYVDLAKMTTHRRAEMEARVNLFNEKCDHAMSNLKKLKIQAQDFVTELNCGPAELRERYLKNITKLESYMYFITDFILAYEQICDEASAPEYTPEQDKSMASLLANCTFNTNNLMDVLSEPIPSASCPCTNLCPPEKPKRVKVPKEDQVLIAFSSASTSSESVPNKKSEMLTKEVQCSLAAEAANMQIEEVSSAGSKDVNLLSVEDVTLPAQTILETDRNYQGTISHTSGVYFWIIVDEALQLADLMEEMWNYYQKQKIVLPIAQARLLTYCVIYDDESNYFYRAITLKEDQKDPNKISLFLVDTGEMRTASAGCLLPLVSRFCERPPFARCCHLAGIDLELYNDTQMMRKYDEFMAKYTNTPCTFLVDENQSESIGVYAMLRSGDTLNNLLVQHGLAELIPEPEPEEEEGSASTQSSPAVGKYSPHTPSNVVRYSPHSSVDAIKNSPQSTAEAVRPYSSVFASGPPDSPVENNPRLDIEINPADPEYDDPVEAVAGYHNRDEQDICKHYKGGPDKTCFKGTRCTKKHIMKHPDGWTLDKVEVVGKLRAAPLPEPGTWLKLHITYVAHFDRVYANIHVDNQEEDTVPEFGVVLPPTTLSSLVRDMNSAAATASYKPLKFAPAPGEIVAAIYPPDNRWYRAIVLTVTRADQSVQVRYIDYGTVLWVKENQIFTLCPRFTVLPMQAICCVLAGVHMTSPDAQHWARTKRALAHMVQDRTLRAHVIARDYDEVTIELLDSEDYSVAQQLAAQGFVQLREYQVIKDSQVTQRATVP